MVLPAFETAKRLPLAQGGLLAAKAAQGGCMHDGAWGWAGGGPGKRAGGGGRGGAREEARPEKR